MRTAGAAIAIVLYSVLTKRKIKNTIALTGEICLQGKITAIGGLDLNIRGGMRAGVTTFLYPKTNTTLLGKERHDDFNVAGFGLAAKVGLNFTFFKYFFIQTELKGGYIEMNNIRTTNDSADSAEQNFWFLQRILTIGGIFRI